MTFKNLFDESPARIRHHAKRGAAKQAALYVIDGQYVTADELAERMGTTKEKAVSKLSKVKAMPGPITWAKLGVSDVSG